MSGVNLFGKPTKQMLVTQRRVIESMNYTGMNPFKRRDAALNQKTFGLGLLSHCQAVTTSFESELSQQVLSTERTVVQLNIFYLHAWMLRHTVQRQYGVLGMSWQSSALSHSLRSIMRNDNVFIFTATWNEQVFQELLR